MWDLGKISEELCGETVEKVTILSSSRALINENYNEIHSCIYEYNSTYLPTFSVNPTRGSKDQIGMASGISSASMSNGTVKLAGEYR